MIALLGLFHAGQIFVQRGLLWERRAINALKHLIFCVTAPISACATGELKGLDPARIRQMRPGAELREFTLPVKGNRLALSRVLAD